MAAAEVLTTYFADVRVSLRPAVLDTQGKAILHGLHAMGYLAIGEVHAGKYYRLSVQAASRDEAETIARAACERLLSNPVIESFSLELSEGSAA